MWGVTDNHLDRQFEASKPNQKWVGDTSAPCGYHVFMDNCWLGVPRGGAGFVLAQGGRLERVRIPRHRTDTRCTQPSTDPAAGHAGHWPAVPFRPRLPIHQPHLPGQAWGIGHPSQYEPTRQLLGVAALGV